MNTATKKVSFKTKLFKFFSGLVPLFILAHFICTTESYVISNVSPQNRSTVLGIYYFASRGGPAILLPIIGDLIDKYSFSTAFTTLGIGLFTITLICTGLLWGTKE